jgi:hypothetical protein
VGGDGVGRTELLQDVLTGVVPAVVAESFERIAGAFVTIAALLAEQHNIFPFHPWYLVS